MPPDSRRSFPGAWTQTAISAWLVVRVLRNDYWLAVFWLLTAGRSVEAIPIVGRGLDPYMDWIALGPENGPTSNSGVSVSMKILSFRMDTKAL